MGSKYYGAVGYAEQVMTSPGVFQEKITERNYYGDILRISSKWRGGGENLNSNLVIDNRISILADPYAFENFHAMRYIHYMGAKWALNSVEVMRPRIILTMGEVYNEQTSGISNDSGNANGDSESSG